MSLGSCKRFAETTFRRSEPFGNDCAARTIEFDSTATGPMLLRSHYPPVRQRTPLMSPIYAVMPIGLIEDDV